MKKISVVALLALTAVPVCGQDLLARQAPVDHRMKALDTLAVSHYRLVEDRENPAAEKNSMTKTRKLFLNFNFNFVDRNIFTSFFTTDKNSVCFIYCIL